MISILKPLSVAVLALSFATQSHADIALKITEIAKGSSVTFLLENGTRQTHHFEGKVGDEYYVTFWDGRGKGLDAGIIGTGFFNADGRLLRSKRVGRPAITYTPHNCFRVIGECLYTATRADGREWKMGRRQTATENGFTFEAFTIRNGVERIRRTGSVTLDEMGMMQSLTVEMGVTELFQSMAQERATYR